MTVKEMKARLTAIAAEAKIAETANDSEKLDQLMAEAETLKSKIENAATLSKLQKIADDFDEGESPDNGESGEPKPESKAEKRGKALKNGEKVVINKAIITPKAAVPSTTTALESHTAPDVKQTFNDVSSIIDVVHTVPLDGGESYKRGFVKTSSGEGDYTSEGDNHTDTEPVFDYVEMKKTKITAYTEEPDEIRKLANAAYSNTISNSVSKAVRKKIAKQIVIGDGNTDHICGIFNAPAKVIPTDTDITVTEINENTLDDIIFSYGGEEDVEGFCGLLLNKADVKAFAKLRDADGRKVYKVVPNGNTGTIDGVPYIINSACPAISNSKTVAGTYCIAYGPWQNYELALFSDLDVQRSTDYKFKQGQIAHRADIYCGGNVATYKGFIRIKKGATASNE